MIKFAPAVRFLSIPNLARGKEPTVASQLLRMEGTTDYADYTEEEAAEKSCRAGASPELTLARDALANASVTVRSGSVSPVTRRVLYRFTQRSGYGGALV